MRGRELKLDQLLIDIVKYGCIAIMTLVAVFPVYWGVVTSLKPFHEMLRYPPRFLLEHFTLEHYVGVLSEPLLPFALFYRNSVIVSSATTLLVILVSSFAAYSLSRLEFPFKDLLANLILFVYLVPRVFLVIPMYLIFGRMHLLNTYWSLILSYSAFAMPFCIWLLKGFFDDIPHELEDSARIDGCTRVGAIFRVILPLSLSGIVAAAMFSFVLCWNEYLFSNTFVKSNAVRTIAVGMNLYTRGETVAYWGELLSSAVMASIPPIALFVFLQKYLVSGFSAGAVKG